MTVFEVVPVVVTLVLQGALFAASDSEPQAPPEANPSALNGSYLGLRRLPPTDGSFISRVVRSYITFFPDGSVFWRLPGEGRDGFDAAASRKAFPDRWGTYRLVGDEVHLDGVERKTTIKARRDGDKIRMTDPTISFTPIPDCTGLKLDGAYRRAAGEPAIRFWPDGKFEDEAVLSVLGEIQKNDGCLERDDGKPGGGTYAIRDNTLHLSYADGRRKKIAFHVFPHEMTGPSPTHVHLLQDTFERVK